MNRKEFLAQLSRLLWDIPEADRKDALEYYENYFEDAGEENESSVIQDGKSGEGGSHHKSRPGRGTE